MKKIKRTILGMVTIGILLFAQVCWGLIFSDFGQDYNLPQSNGGNDFDLNLNNDVDLTSQSSGDIPLFTASDETTPPETSLTIPEDLKLYFNEDGWESYEGISKLVEMFLTDKDTWLAYQKQGFLDKELEKFFSQYLQGINQQNIKDARKAFNDLLENIKAESPEEIESQLMEKLDSFMDLLVTQAKRIKENFDNIKDENIHRISNLDKGIIDEISGKLLTDEFKKKVEDKALKFNVESEKIRKKFKDDLLNIINDYFPKFPKLDKKENLRNIIYNAIENQDVGIRILLKLSSYKSVISKLSKDIETYINSGGETSMKELIDKRYLVIDEEKLEKEIREEIDAWGEENNITIPQEFKDEIINYVKKNPIDEKLEDKVFNNEIMGYINNWEKKYKPFAGFYANNLKEDNFEKQFNTLINQVIEKFKKLDIKNWENLAEGINEINEVIKKWRDDFKNSLDKSFNDFITQIPEEYQEGFKKLIRLNNFKKIIDDFSSQIFKQVDLRNLSKLDKFYDNYMDKGGDWEEVDLLLREINDCLKSKKWLYY
jgi:uncharacterized FlaG/YvyC family protein